MAYFVYVMFISEFPGNKTVTLLSAISKMFTRTVQVIANQCPNCI